MSTGGSQSDNNVTFNFKIESDPKSADEAAKIGKVAEDNLEKFKKSTEQWSASTKQQLADLKAAQDALKEQSAAHDTLKASMLSAADGALKLAKDSALFGLASEKDMQKVVAGVLKLQAGYDALKSGLQVVRDLHSAWSAYTVIVEAAAAATGRAIGGHAVGGAVSAAGGAAVGAGRSAAGGVGSSIVGAGIELGGAVAGGAATEAAGGAIAGAGGIGAVAGAAAGAAAPVTAAAIITALAVGVVIEGVQIARDKLSGAGGGLSEGPHMQALGEAIYNYTPFIGDQGAGEFATGAKDRSNRLGAEQQIRQNQLRNETFANQQRAITDSVNAQRDQNAAMGASASDASFDADGSFTPSSRARLRREQNRIRGINADSALAAAQGAQAPAGAGGAEIKNDRELSAVNEVLAARKEELALLQASHKEAIDMVNEQIKGAERTLSLAQAHYEAVKKSGEDATQHFGAADVDQQQSALAAAKKFKEQGAASLTDEELAAVRGIGLAGSDEVARAETKRRANDRGFGDIANIFGQKGREDQAKAEVDAAKIDLNAKQEIKITLDGNFQDAQEAMLAKIDQLLQMWGKSMEERTQLQIAAMQAKQDAVAARATAEAAGGSQ